MNDENLEIFLYNQFNQILDSNEDTSDKQQRLGQLFIMASNSISAIYLTTHEKEAEQMMKMAGTNLDLKSLLRNEWYIYTNIEIWIDFLYSVYNELLPNHPQYNRTPPGGGSHKYRRDCRGHTKAERVSA